MEIIPAIDIKDGRCVRLKQGDMQSATVFAEDPAAMAQHWLEQGAKRLHLVDLNGAFAGKPVNAAAVETILKSVKVPVQLGGGIRHLAQIEDWFARGIARVILGTVALKNPALVKEACRKFPGKIAVGIDAKGGKVAVEGWAETSDVTALDLARKFEDAGAAVIIFTDIDRDGLLQGVNVESTAQLARSISVPVIASGGVSSLADIEALLKITPSTRTYGGGIIGVISGRALYDGSLDLGAALKRLKEAA